MLAKICMYFRMCSCKHDLQQLADIECDYDFGLFKITRRNIYFRCKKCGYVQRRKLL